MMGPGEIAWVITESLSPLVVFIAGLALFLLIVLGLLWKEK